MDLSDISIKDEHMWRVANMLAHSGVYDDWRAIEHELNARGYPRARQLLRRQVIRARLNRECFQARKSRSDA